jgi:3-dehydroquinate dehydratase-2
MYSILEIDYFQSNVEGELINKLHEVGFTYDGIVINAGGYTHTSVALADAIAAINTPVIEVHVSNIYAREEYRHVSLTGKNCKGVLTGFGLDGYRLAIESLLKS